MKIKFCGEGTMLLFMLAASVIMVINCIISDKIEKFIESKRGNKQDNIEKVLDIETINILKNYGLISKDI